MKIQVRIKKDRVDLTIKGKKMMVRVRLKGETFLFAAFMVKVIVELIISGIIHQMY